jgi:hypothetical protein
MTTSTHAPHDTARPAQSPPIAAGTRPPRSEASSEATRRRGWLMWTVWAVATLAGAGVIASSHDIGEPSAIKATITMLPLLGLTALFVRWLGPVPLQPETGASTTRRSRLTLLIVAVTVPLFAAGLLGLAVLAILALAAGIATVLWRADYRRREVLVAVGLAALAALGGSASWFATGKTSDLLFAVSMLPLVTLTLLAGWAAGRRGGWDRTAVGRTLLLTDGRVSALKAFAFGALVGIPWALGNISNGPGVGDTMKTPWQPVATVMFGVSEEAWARVFLISVLFLIFRKVAQAPTALLTAALVATYWFAFIHIPGNPVGTLLMGTIFVLPMTYLYLRRGLEAAIGFHICANLVKFTAAYLVTAGIWFT